MRLTEAEMNLENLESSSAYDGAMIGDLLLFQANTNIPHEQSVPLIQEVVHRCNSHDALLKACEVFIEAFKKTDDMVRPFQLAKAAIAQAKKT